MSNAGLDVRRNYLFLGLFAVLVSDQILDLGLTLVPGLSLKNLFLYLLLFYLATTAIIRGDFLNSESPSVLAIFILFGIYATVSWAFASTIYDFYDAKFHLIRLKGQIVDPILFFVLFFFGLRSIPDIMWLAQRICILIAIICAVLFIDFIDFPDLGILDANRFGRMAGAVGTTNQFATFLSFYFFSMIAVLISRQTFWLVLFGTFAASALIVLTASRGAFVGLIGTCMIGTFLIRRHIDIRQVFRIGAPALAAFVLIVIVVAAVYPELITSRVERSQAATLVAASSGRTLIWSRALGVMIEQPYSLIVGFGWDTFFHSRIHTDPHNYYLFIFYGLGLIGLGLLLWTFRRIIRLIVAAMDVSDNDVRRLLIGYLYGLIAMMVSIFFVLLYTPWPFIWAYTGLMTRLAWLSTRSIRPENAEAV